MTILEFLADIFPSLLSILACFVAFMKGKKTLTVDEIEEKAEKYKAKKKQKLMKKNKVTPLEDSSATVQTVAQNATENFKHIEQAIEQYYGE